MISIRQVQAGLSLVELMISVTLGLLILSGVVAVATNSSGARSEIEKTSRQIENGRYAMQVIADDLQMAGFLGELPTPPAAPASLPDPCATSVADLKTAMPLHVQGYDNTSGGLTCISDVKSGTDVLVVRRAASCSSANPLDTNCDAVTSGYAYLQVSGCATDTAPSGQTNAPYYQLDTNTSNLTLRKIGCTATGAIRRYRTHIYFVANNNIGSDGIPTLKRWELGGGIVPLVEGIENLQIEYGIDSNNDGVPNAYTAGPATVADWANTMAVKVNVLARNTAATAGYSDTKTYVLGLKADGSDNTFGPYADAYKRHAYNAAVRLANPAGRRE